MNTESLETLAKKIAMEDKPKKEPHPLAGVELFTVSDERVVSESNARYIYILLDEKDKALITMLQLPHLREELIKGNTIDPDAVARLVDWNVVEAHSPINRIRRLCSFGAIVTRPDIGWVPNPKVVSQISQRAQ